MSTVTSVPIAIYDYRLDFYEVTEGILHTFPSRTCLGCSLTFRIGDWVSLVFTNRGNRLLHRSCLEVLLSGTELCRHNEWEEDGTM